MSVITTVQCLENISAMEGVVVVRAMCLAATASECPLQTKSTLDADSL